MAATLDDITWPVRTERLTLRPATPQDLEPTWEFRRLPAVTYWMMAAHDTIDQYRGQFDDPERLATTLVLERDGRVIGDLMLRIEDAWSQREVADKAQGAQAELGWCLHPDHAGQGYATEAVRELMRLCFEDLGLHRVVANCFAGNEPSWRLMERVGMRCEGRFVGETLHRTEGWVDALPYALLADEWRNGPGR